MSELNQNGDSQDIIATPIIEPVQNVSVGVVEPKNSVSEQVDNLFNNKQFVDTFFARVGDGVSKIVEQQVDKRVAESLQQVQSQSSSHSQTLVNPVTPTVAEPQQVVQTPVVEPKVGSADEAVLLKQRLADIEGSMVTESIRKLPLITELSTLNPQEAERFIQRAVSIAKANNLAGQGVGAIFSENADITKDVRNQIVALSRSGTFNKPTNEPIVPAQNNRPTKYAEMAKHFYGNKR